MVRDEHGLNEFSISDETITCRIEGFSLKFYKEPEMPYILEVKYINDNNLEEIVQNLDIEYEQNVQENTKWWWSFLLFLPGGWRISNVLELTKEGKEAEHKSAEALRIFASTQGYPVHWSLSECMGELNLASS